MKTTEENGLIFWRYHCKEGFIDYWMGDASIDPNNWNGVKPNFQLNSFITMYRLNGKGEWYDRSDWKSSFHAIIQRDCEIKTAEEIWNEFKIN
jgi:hypothetical protein